MENQSLFEKYRRGRHWDDHPDEYARNFAIFLKSRNFKGRVLDLGCGSGRDVEAFSSYELDVCGIDISEVGIANAIRLHPGRQFLQHDMTNLNFLHACIGACFAINVIHYVNQSIALREIYRILSPGGWLYIHFNLKIRDDDTSRIDYEQDYEQVRDLVREFRCEGERIFKRNDKRPIPHTHTILELILQKP